MINKTLRFIRVFNNMKAVELSEKLSISRSYLSEIENDKKRPSLEIIKKYAEIFNTKPSAILFFSEQFDEDSINNNKTFKNKFKINVKKTIRKKIISLLQEIENAK